MTNYQSISKAKLVSIFYSKSDEDAGNSVNEDNPNLKTQPSSPPVEEIVSGANDSEPDYVAVQPKLSMATDGFFLHDSSTKKSTGMNNLMERLV